jgi:GcrA cell cycle regulator
MQAATAARSWLVSIALSANGLSSRQIANEIGGKSRNAVIGKIHRLGLVLVRTKPAVKAPRKPRRAGNIPTYQRPAAARGNMTVKKAAIPDVEPTIAGWPKPKGPNAIRFTSQKNDRSRCKMPLWDDETPSDQRFVCGDAVVPGASWCPACYRRITRKPGEQL